MKEHARPGRFLHKQFMLRLVAIGVFMNGLLVLFSALLSHLLIFGHVARSDVRISLALVIGMSLIYLSSLIVRRKQAAWAITLVVYAFLLGINVSSLLAADSLSSYGLSHLLRSVILPVGVVCGLAYYRHEFTVKSDIRNFTLSLRFIALVLLIAFFYGVGGFLLLDRHDFHQEINLPLAAHYTVDQFNITTTHPAQAYTERGRLFLYSLSLVSTLSLIYAAISLFQPLRARFSDQARNRQAMDRILTKHGGSSEDYFKLYPYDKQYFLTPDQSAGLAFRVERGVALIVGDPAGDKYACNQLLEMFEELCHTNDWLPAFIHTEPKWSSFYKKNDFALQKIGEEAILELNHFIDKVLTGKYFRNIVSKFERAQYKAELLVPPHTDKIMNQLKTVSSDWLSIPGREERGLMMGYFDISYIRNCPVMVLRDTEGTIQAFINQIPSFDPKEANYDLLRHTKQALGNSNDFLLLSFAKYLSEQGFERLNLGLCPLHGLKVSGSGDKTIINSTLEFVYSNGNRFYSFSGLYRFKAKYEPNWQGRYIAYRGGIRGFTRTINALNRGMSHIHHSR